MNAKASLPTGSSLCAETRKALSLLKHQIGLVESEAVTLDELSRFGSRQNPFENESKAYSSQIEAFQRDFKDLLEWNCTDAEIGGLYVPRPRGYCKTLLVLPPAKVIAGPETLCAKWRAEKKFTVWTFADGALNEKIRNDRRHLGMYALLHKGGRDADAELRNYSWERAQSDSIETMRATEVLYFEDVNFRRKEEHLDPESVTITSSLDSDGYAVNVNWYGNVNVNQYDVRHANPSYGPRAAVFL